MRATVRRFARNGLISVVLSGIFPLLLNGQTTQGLISGFVRAQGKAIAQATIFYCRLSDDGAIQQRGKTSSGPDGYYFFPLLTPGQYRFRAQAESGAVPETNNDCFQEPAAVPAYQAQEKHDLMLTVAAWLQVDFDLRPALPLSDSRAANYLTTNGSVARYFGADDRRMKSISVDTGPASQQTGGSTVSYAIDPVQISSLPLSGQNVFQLLSFQPGVSSILTVNGQRSSLFLLDGIEGAPAFGPEFIEEYRVSTGNYSAEFGRTTGFIANAITRSGSNQFHGLLYAYLNNEILNANAFQSNFQGFPRPRYREVRSGFWTGGPLTRGKTFFSAGYEPYRSRTWEYPFTYQVPVLAAFENCPATAHSQALALLERFPPPLAPPPGGPPCETLSAPYTVSQPVVIDRSLGLIHLDHLLRNGKDHLALRGIANLETDPYASFSLYKDFISASKTNSTSVAVDLTSSVANNIMNDFRAGWSRVINSAPRAHPEIPELSTNQDGSRRFTSGVIALPGESTSSTAGRNRTDTFQFGDSMTVSRRRQIIILGGGLFASGGTSYNGYAPSGVYHFNTLQDFGQDSAALLTLAVSRKSVIAGQALTQPSPIENDRRLQFYGFIQDNLKLSQRLAIHFGLRYDYFGAPQYTSADNAPIQLGSGTVQDAFRAARFVFSGSQCCGNAYNPDKRDWGPRLGLAWDLTASGKHVFRTAWGLLYDITPGASTHSNTLEEIYLYSFTRSIKVDYSNGPLNQSLLSQPLPQLPQPLAFARRIEAPMVQTWFAGLQNAWSPGLTTEFNYLGSAGRRLITTDLVNRTDSTLMDTSRLNSMFPDVIFVSNSGYSDYNAFTSLVRYRPRGNSLLVQASYTLSHSIDNGGGYFTRQFNTELDRGNSDFDQRHNLVLYAIATLPFSKSGAWRRFALQGWTAGVLAGLRSGFPYTVFANPAMKSCDPNASAGSGPVLYQNRASLVPGVSPELSNPISVGGGVQLLDAAAFCLPATNVPGTVGRNSLVGPGFWNVDMSLARSFPLRWLGEASTFQFRADFFNIFNHANLGNPLTGETAFGQFGEAFFGKSAAPPGNVSFVPLDEVPRRIELQIKVRF